MPSTIGDAIAAKKKAEAELKPAQAAIDAANATLKRYLRESGPVYVRGTNGIEVFVADESSLGFRTFPVTDAATIPAPETPPPVEPPAPAAGSVVEPASAEAQWNKPTKPSQV